MDETANPTFCLKEGESFDHSIRSKAHLHQALEQRRYAPKNRIFYFIEGLMLRVFCWSHDFRLCNGDPMHAPIWVSQPHMPIVFFFEFRLFSIVSIFEIGLTLDGPTKLVSRLKVARVCVEVGLLSRQFTCLLVRVRNFCYR